MSIYPIRHRITAKSHCGVTTYSVHYDGATFQCHIADGPKVPYVELVLLNAYGGEIRRWCSSRTRAEAIQAVDTFARSRVR